MNELLILFIVLNAINVVIQTIKSLCTINCGKTVAALVNALAYGFYTVVVVYMVCDLPLLWKVLIVGACNFVGVFLVKRSEEHTSELQSLLIVHLVCRLLLEIGRASCRERV